MLDNTARGGRGCRCAVHVGRGNVFVGDVARAGPERGVFAIDFREQEDGARGGDAGKLGGGGLGGEGGAEGVEDDGVRRIVDLGRVQILGRVYVQMRLIVL